MEPYHSQQYKEMDMTIQIRQNLLIQWHDSPENPLVERVLYIDDTATKVLVFDIRLGKTNALPVWRMYRDVVAALLGKHAHVLEIDPFAKYLHREEDDIPEMHKARRDAAWEAIKPLVLDDQGNLRLAFYDPQERHQLISEAAKRYKSNIAATTEVLKVSVDGVQPDERVEGSMAEPQNDQETDEGTRYAKKKFYEWCRKWWRGGMIPNALLPYWYLSGSKNGQRTITKKLGRPSKRSVAEGEPIGVNVDAHVQDLLVQGYHRFFDPKKQYPWKFSYLQTMALFFNDGHELKPSGAREPILKPAEQRPTLEQFKYYGKKSLDKNYVKELKRLLGLGTFNLKARALLGNSTQMAFGPMSLYQVDAWVADLYVVSALNRRWIIGRPIVYIIIDVFSRLIVGFSVALEGPSWAGALLALQNVVEDKVSLCAEYGIAISPEMWPTGGLPRALLADRGEFEGYNANTLENAFGVRIVNTPPYRGDLKAIVERDFLAIINLTVQFIPGFVNYKIRERGQKDYRLDGCLTLDEFREILIRHIIYHNNAWRMKWYRRDEFAIQDEVPPIPIRLWSWGIENRIGALSAQHSPEQVRLALLPRANASTTPQGLLFESMHYTIAFPCQERWYMS
jgi:putative transposase